MSSTENLIEVNGMDRKDTANETARRLYGPLESPLYATDSGFADVKRRFVYGDVYTHVKLGAVLREQIILAVATVNVTPDEVYAHTLAALSSGASVQEIKEAVYQCAPYVGIGKTEVAVKAVNSALASRGVDAVYRGGGTVGEDDRLERGIGAQKAIFGDGIDAMRASASEDTRHIQDYLSAWCFGDYYTREGLPIERRELLTFCMLCAQGGCEPQLRSHISGNLAVGNDRDTLLDALTVCLPYIGFPRALNALSAINDIAK